MKIGRKTPLFVFFSFPSFLLRRGRRLRRPEKPTIQTDRRGRRSLQGFSKNPSVCFLWFLFFSRRARRLRQPEKPTIQTDRRGRRSLQGFSNTPSNAFFWSFSSPVGVGAFDDPKNHKTNGQSRTSVPTENNHARSRSYSGNARNRTAPFYGGAVSSREKLPQAVRSVCGSLLLCCFLR